MKRVKNNFIELFELCPDELKNLAFTHSSFAHEKGLESNERIEFLGDSVLSTIVSEYLYKHYHEAEGKMTRLRASFVCTENLATIAKKYNIQDRIKVGKSYRDQISDAVLADTIECMIGAMFLSFGMSSISSAVIEVLELKQKMRTNRSQKDAKTQLQEYVQQQKRKLEYRVETYTTKGGQENFRSSVFVDDEFLSYGQSSTKREAEQNAAKLALKKLIK